MSENNTYNLVLGTAGHIDHGKSSLICALTGTDPDRLAEEKQRGITIELGFAQLSLPGGRTMSVVDVPGHERFVRQMIQGATGIDVALLVIAADDGVMPQTREHVIVLETLGVSHCVVALTKCDLVDDEWLSMMEHDVSAYLAQTAYAQAPMVPVSSQTGQGLDELKQTLANVCEHISRAKTSTSVRLPVDRSFSIKGAGTVVTGTLWSGAIGTDDELEVLPGGKRWRVRSIQEHDAPVECAHAGNRVALNLNGAHTDDVTPGVFLATPGAFHMHDRFDCTVTYRDVAQLGKPLTSGTQVRVAHGTREVMGRLLLFDGRQNLAPGDKVFAQVRLEEPLAVSYGDRFVLRTCSPVNVAGGGMVLLASPRRRSTLKPAETDLLTALEAGDQPAAMDAAVRMHDVPFSAQELASELEFEPAQVERHLEEVASGNALVLLKTGDGTFFLRKPAFDKLMAALERTLIGFHASHRDALGMTKEELRVACADGASTAAFDALIDAAVAAGKAVNQDGLVGHPASHAAAQANAGHDAETVLDVLTASGLTPPDLQHLVEDTRLSLPQVRTALTALTKDGRVWRQNADLFFAASALDKAADAIRAFIGANGAATMAQLRDALGTTRKYAVPLLEHFDEVGVTKRVGDLRELK